ncbi:hypothetical protein OR16_19620 [Cupriavidus basilensis OR16]|uniref:Uncharacterized protein n=1 Tax=Cupriavidus basilensis OR16 TaxID=1127483 RepID=H1S7J7_9BURK|nr:hypothetical protein [Cupriavidus basilensis]EHP41411.1 hypothetical protein OR16_19620 [Cupriavidus basilensis OR16]
MMVVAQAWNSRPGSQQINRLEGEPSTRLRQKGRRAGSISKTRTRLVLDTWIPGTGPFFRRLGIQATPGIVLINE